MKLLRPAIAGTAAAVLSILGASPAGGQQAPAFTDIAAEAGLDFVHFNGMSGELYFAENMGAGGAFVDYDRDGDLDVYLVQGNMLGKDKTIDAAVFPPLRPLPLTDRLYRNDLSIAEDGGLSVSFVDVTEASGLEARGYGMGVAAGDFDNDGWVDLYLTNFGPNQLLRNNGDGTFSDVTLAGGADDRRWSVSASFFDYDRDGWLDLYVANYVDFRIATHKACAAATGDFNYCGPLAYNAEPDRLLRNRGDGTFEDVTSSSKVGAEFGAGLGVVAADFNGDGWLDLYVANDQTPNQMWINQRNGTFLNEALLSGTAVNEVGQPEASMGVVAADFDGDGSEDLFMTHIDRQTNTLYLNDGGGLFEDSTRDSVLGQPSFMLTGFGTAVLDYDGDGWQDLFVANGAVQRLEPLVRRGDPYPLHQRNQLFRNTGEARFEEVSSEALPLLAVSEVSRGAAVGDVDEDGDPDLLLTNNAGPVRLWLNQSGERPWLGLRLLAAGLERDALGARVAIEPAGGAVLRRRVAADGSYASANDPRVTAALGGADSVARVRVHWPSGGVGEWRGLPLGRRVTLVEGDRGAAP